MDQRIVAHHEAAHAVASYRLGFEIGAATIIPNDEAATDGMSVGQLSTLGDKFQDADYVVSLYAGGSAQRRFDPATGSDGCDSDDDAADELLDRHSDLIESELRRRADELVAAYWPEIKAVAALLLEEQTVSGDDIETICLAVEEGEEWRETLLALRSAAQRFKAYTDIP